MEPIHVALTFTWSSRVEQVDEKVRSAPARVFSPTHTVTTKDSRQQEQSVAKFRHRDSNPGRSGESRVS